MQDVENVYQDAYYKTKCLEGLFIHDISNLFQIISNSIELCGLLLKDEVKKEDIMEYFHLIAQQLTRGKKLIRNVRNLADLEEYEMVLEPVEVFSELRNAVNFTLNSFPNREIKVKFISHYKKLYAMANELLSEVFENIIINSIKYNKNKVAQIEIVVSKVDFNSENYVKIEFKDNGIGIDDDRKHIIFQEAHLKRRNSNGMGIGLSLVAKLIELYGGEIWVENRIGGDTKKGSNFVILIPFIKKKKVMFNDK
ncbi:MAG: HAMP domain-containing histidine kinase [Candidatus Lokiarchaeota archaeon]|nr:HAMP domain-containing histidine kinase [Candidatus Lokiarchaeota archaeon]